MERGDEVLAGAALVMAWVAALAGIISLFACGSLMGYFGLFALSRRAASTSSFRHPRFEIVTMRAILRSELRIKFYEH